MSWHSLPLFVRLAGRPVILLGEGDAADAKRRLLERAGAMIVGENADAQFAIVALAEPDAAAARFKARGVLVNAVDRPDLCDFTLPAIVDRDPVLIAIGTGGASAGLAAALRQRLETLLPASLGGLTGALHAARARLRERFPETGARRRALGTALTEGGALDPLRTEPDAVAHWLDAPAEDVTGIFLVGLRSSDPDDLTLREARALANADRVFHAANVPPAILDRARADAPRIVSTAPPVEPGPGLTVYVEMT